MLQTFDENLLSLIDVKEIEGDIMQSELIKDKIAQLQSKIVEFLNKPANRKETIEEHVSGLVTPLSDSLLDPKRVDSPASAGSLLLTTSSIEPAVRTGTGPKLLKLHLPKFLDDITKFRIFWDSYESAIHRNLELSPIDRFNYFRALLDGPAANAIQGLNLTDANYTAAIELIKECYGKTQQILSAHMDELLKIPNGVGDKTPQLWAVYDMIGVNIHG